MPYSDMNTITEVRHSQSILSIPLRLTSNSATTLGRHDQHSGALSTKPDTIAMNRAFSASRSCISAFSEQSASEIISTYTKPMKKTLTWREPLVTKYIEATHRPPVGRSWTEIVRIRRSIDSVRSVDSSFWTDEVELGAWDPSRKPTRSLWRRIVSSLHQMFGKRRKPDPETPTPRKIIDVDFPIPKEEPIADSILQECERTLIDTSRSRKAVSLLVDRRHINAPAMRRISSVHSAPAWTAV
jgi:hypothetical protein